MAVTCSVFAGILIMANIYKDKPSAMDVYQGKTTIEYKVVDGEVIDSCVVWKKNE